MLAPRADDAHQDHRLLGTLAPTVWRDALVLYYEIPKWDGDLATPSHYVALDRATARRKVELLHRCFPSQSARDWWDDELFLGLLRLRGIEASPKSMRHRRNRVLLAVSTTASPSRRTVHARRWR